MGHALASIRSEAVPKRLKFAKGRRYIGIMH